MGTPQARCKDTCYLSPQADEPQADEPVRGALGELLEVEAQGLPDPTRDCGFVSSPSPRCC